MDPPRIMYEEDIYYYVSDKQKKTNKYPSVSPIPVNALYEEDYSSVVKKS